MLWSLRVDRHNATSAGLASLSSRRAMGDMETGRNGKIRNTENIFNCVTTIFAWLLFKDKHRCIRFTNHSSMDYIPHSWRWRMWLLDNQKLGVYVALETKGDSCASGPGVWECECEWVGWLVCKSVWVYCAGLKSNHSCYCFTSQTSWARGTGLSSLYTNLHATQYIRWIICKCLTVNYHVLSWEVVRS